jgi:hypothetical protein
MRELLTRLQEDMKHGRRAVVFSQWTSFLDLIGTMLESVAIPYRVFNGSLSRDDRRKRVEWLSEEVVSGGMSGRVLLISLKAGGTGLNLVAATRLYLMDMWWNPAVEEQAIQRVHRIGQTSEVHVYRFVIADSIDTDVFELHRAKERLLEDALQGGLQQEASSKLTIEDFKRLFNPCRKALHGLRASAADVTEATSAIPANGSAFCASPGAFETVRAEAIDVGRNMICNLSTTFQEDIDEVLGEAHFGAGASALELGSSASATSTFVGAVGTAAGAHMPSMAASGAVASGVVMQSVPDDSFACIESNVPSVHFEHGTSVADAPHVGDEHGHFADPGNCCTDDDDELSDGDFLAACLAVESQVVQEPMQELVRFDGCIGGADSAEAAGSPSDSHGIASHPAPCWDALPSDDEDGGLI